MFGPCGATDTPSQSFCSILLAHRRNDELMREENVST